MTCTDLKAGGDASDSISETLSKFIHVHLDRVENVYGHLGEVRHRAEAVDYRVEQHRETLAERLETLKAGAGLAL